MRAWVLSGCGAGIAGALCVLPAAASSSAVGPCEKPCKYDIVAAVATSSPTASATYSAVFRGVRIFASRTPIRSDKPQSVYIGASDTPGQLKARVDFHPEQPSDCASWREDYNVRARFGLKGFTSFVRPIETRVSPPIWGMLDVGFAPLRELAPGKPCPDFDEGIGWATDVGVIQRRDGRVAVSVYLGQGSFGSTSSGVGSLDTAFGWKHHGRHRLEALGFPLDRLWSGRGFKVVYRLRGNPGYRATVRLEFLRRR